MLMLILAVNRPHLGGRSTTSLETFQSQQQARGRLGGLYTGCNLIWLFWPWMTGTTLYFQEEGTNSQARRARGAGEEKWRRWRRQGGARGGRRGGAGGAAQDRGRIRPQRPSQQDPLHVPWQRTLHLEVSDHLGLKSKVTAYIWSGFGLIWSTVFWTLWRLTEQLTRRYSILFEAFYTFFCCVHLCKRCVSEFILAIDIDFHAYTFLCAQTTK